MRRILWAVLLGCFIAGPAAAADIAGQWSIKASIAGMNPTLVFDFQQHGDKLTGTCKGPGAPPAGVAITGTTTAKKVDWSYSLTYQGMDLMLTYHAVLTTPTSMTGTIDMMGQSGTFTGTKTGTKTQ